MDNTSGRSRGPVLKGMLSGSEMVMLLIPFWIVVFYFRNYIAEKAGRILLLPVHGNTVMTETVVFFISTLLKVFLLLLMVIFIMGIIRTWLPVSSVRKRLSKLPPLAANGLAGVIGVISPFCSCSAIPVFISFLEAGVPLGITFSFLIASPLVNEIILIMLFSLFGWKVAVVYLVAGLIIAVLSGFIIDMLKLEKHLPAWLLTFRNVRAGDYRGESLGDRVDTAISSVIDVLSRTWVFILAGILAGSIIHGYVPDSFLYELTSRDKWYSLPLVVLTGIPLYSCSAAAAPVALALFGKGMPLGTALAFIMSVAGLSLPEFIMLRKVLSFRLILIFASIVFAGILIMGYLFNMVF